MQLCLRRHKPVVTCLQTAVSCKFETPCSCGALVLLLSQLESDEAMQKVSDCAISIEGVTSQKFRACYSLSAYCAIRRSKVTLQHKMQTSCCVLAMLFMLEGMHEYTEMRPN